MKQQTVCILFGGMSPEHEVSLRSAECILNNIKYNREDCSKKIIEEGYDINCTSEEIQKFFLTRKNNE